MWFQKFLATSTVVGVVAIVVTPLIILGVWGSPQMKTDQRPDFIARLVSTGVTLIGGVVLFLNFKNAQDNTQLAEKRFEAEINRAAGESKLETSRLLAERFSKAIEQLGTDQVTVHLGGIYSLEKLLQDSPQEYYWTVIEVLTSFIRSHSSAFPFPGKQKELSSIPVDIQAALTVIGRCNIISEGAVDRRVDLSNANLTEAQFNGNLSFKNFLFEGACCNKAYLANVDLSRSILNRAKLNNVNQLENGQPVQVAKFISTQLIQAEIMGAQLSRADFSGANLQQANLSSSNLYQSKFAGAKLIGTILDNANLSQADFTKANLSGASLVDANLRGANFLGAEVSPDQLSKAKNYEQALQQINIIE